MSSRAHSLFCYEGTTFREALLDAVERGRLTPVSTYTYLSIDLSSITMSLSTINRNIQFKEKYMYVFECILF